MRFTVLQKTDLPTVDQKKKGGGSKFLIVFVILKEEEQCLQDTTSHLHNRSNQTEQSVLNWQWIYFLLVFAGIYTAREEGS